MDSIKGMSLNNSNILDPPPGSALTDGWFQSCQWLLNLSQGIIYIYILMHCD